MGNPEPDIFREENVGKIGEKNLQKVTGCKLTPGSGSGKTKGDGILGERMYEKKSTQNKTLNVRREDLEKLRKEAFDCGKEPIFVIEFETGKYGGEQWAMVPLDRLEELFENFGS